MMSGKIEGLEDLDIGEQLGEGGSAVVYRAWHHSLRRFVAVKAPREGWNNERAQRLRREALIATHLQDHPNIVRIHELRELRNGPCIIMELIEGESLKERMRHGGIPLTLALHIIASICSALEYAHQRRVVHADISMSNVMLRKDGRSILIDFGHARPVTVPSWQQEPEPIEDGYVGMSVISFMAPEIWRRQCAIDGRTDIYAMGVLIYFLVTGQYPFDINTCSRIRMAALNDFPLPPRSRNCELPPEMDRIVLQCLEKAPGDRYQLVERLRSDIERLMLHLGTK